MVLGQCGFSTSLFLCRLICGCLAVYTDWLAGCTTLVVLPLSPGARFRFFFPLAVPCWTLFGPPLLQRVLLGFQFCAANALNLTLRTRRPSGVQSSVWT
ncbi:hypothetical protein DFH94DRAFT_709795 [Russula ochroleuca]|uniref:Uncharacterized protein n=1 Tax=Russula ochroleuca TaxID=152965 RepID=A0A9P5N4I4_9AGAM|nr:hypothetical protein DFH94DRAFT_709795 [Russula ochroleuca]